MCLMDPKYSIVVQVPLYNEEENIDAVIDEIPSSIDGIGELKVLFVDDGSTDKSYDLLTQRGVTNIVRHPRNMGLGCAHKSGLEYAVNNNADIVVNFDADLQYRGSEIKDIIQPIIDKKADVVIGDRQRKTLEWYPKHKHFTQGLWNTIISILYNTRMVDATSGFRAYNKETMKLLFKNCKDPYTYSAESLYILLKKKRRISFIPIHIRPTYRKSRLVSNKIFYVYRFLRTLLRCYFKVY